MKHKLFFFYVLICSVAQSQEPETVLQENFEEGINGIHQSPEGKYFLVETGTQTKRLVLWDQASKIMLARKELFTGNGQGSGHINLLNNGKVLVSSNHSIVKLDLLKGDTSTVIDIFEHPEYHLKFEVVPWDSNKIIIPSKIYSEDDENIYDKTDNGRLVVYDMLQNEIFYEKKVDYEITEISFHSNTKKIALGTNHGDCILLDSTYKVTDRVKLTNKPILFLDISINELIIANENYSVDHSFWRGSGELVIYNMQTQTHQILEMEKQGPTVKQKSDDPIRYTNSKLVDNILVNPSEKRVYVNYGYNRVDRINPFNLKIDRLNIPNYEAVEYINFNKDSSKLYLAYGNLGMIPLANKVSIYDINREKEAFAFKDFDEPQKFENYYLKYDDNGDYYFISRKSKSGYSYQKYDSLLVFSSKGLKPKNIVCNGCKFKLQPKTDELIAYNDKLVLEGNLHLSDLKDDIEINLNYGAWKTSDSLVFELSNKTQLDDVLPRSLSITDIIILNKGKYIVCSITEYRKGKRSSKIVIIDENEVILEKAFEFSPIFRVSDNERFVAFNNGSLTGKSSVYVYDLIDRRIVYKENFKNGVQHFDFDLRNPVLYISYTTYDSDGYGDYFLHRLDLREKKLKLEKVDESQDFFTFIVDESNNVIAGQLYNNVFVYDMISNELVYELRGETTANKTLSYIPGLKGFGFNLSDRFHVYKTPIEQLDFFIFNDSHNALINNMGYYQINKDVLHNFGFSLLGKGYPPSDFDFYLNRPDKIYEFLNGGNQNHLKILEKAQKKRGRHLDEIELGTYLRNDSLPSIVIPEKQHLLDFTQNEKIQMPFQAIDVNTKLKKIHLYVNGVPHFGKNGRGIDVPASNRFHDTISIPLIGGVNRLSIYAENASGLRSLPETWEIVKEDSKKKPNLYLNLISVSEYEQSQFDLQYAVKDGQDLASLFNQYDSLYNKVIINKVFDEEVNRKNVKALKNKLLETEVDDHVILFVSGHGLLDDNFDFYFATHDMDFDNPSAKGVSYDELEWLLDSIPARKKLFMMDACHSGEVDKEELMAFNSEKEEGMKSGVKKYTYRADILQYDEEVEQGVGLQNSFRLMQEMFTNLNRGSGAVVISAAAGDSYALESDEWQNGVFTYSLLEGLRYGYADANNDDKVTVSELRDYVSGRVQDLTNGLQKPTMRQENIEFDFRVW